MGKWVKKKLGDLGYSFSGLSGKTIDDFGGGKPYIPYMNIFTNGKINSKQLEYVRIAENERQNKVEQGDWFFTTSSETPDEVGMTSVLVDDIGEAYLNSFCFGFRLYKKSEFDPEFVSYLFRSVELRKKISLFAQGSTRYNLPKQQMFEKLYISYSSSLSEQRRIASILSSADKVIDSTQKLIAKYKSIKQGMMEDLLKPKEGWKKVKLGEVCELSSEKYNPLTESFFQYSIEMENINQESGTINGYSDITKLLSLKTKFHKGDVLYGKLRPYLKKYWLADFDGACSTEIWVLKNADNIDNRFLFYIFQSEHINKIANLSSGTKMPRADWSFMREQELYIPYQNDNPDLSEQRRIASILSSIDKKIESEEKALEKYKNIKKGLMEKLLRGE